MIQRKSFHILVMFVLTVSCLSIQAASQILITAKHLIAKTDSLAATYASNAKLGFIQTSDIDTNGAANIWTYAYFSFDTLNLFNSRAYYFDVQNNVVAFEYWDSLLVGPFAIINRWMDSDSALQIAQHAGGSAIRKQFPGCTITAILIQMPAPPIYTEWQISYKCSDSTRSVYINASTGDVVRWFNIVTSVNDAKNQAMPIRFDLGQNYPDPFNPSTKISYSIPTTGLVTLKVYNILGQEVATLFSGMRNAGNYEETFDGSKLASGVYFYRLQTGNQTLVKKMLMLK